MSISSHWGSLVASGAAVCELLFRHNVCFALQFLLESKEATILAEEQGSKVSVRLLFVLLSGGDLTS